MKQLTLVAFAVALGLAATTPARADFAVVQFRDGHCQRWWDSGSNPWGAGWRKIVIGLPNWEAATAALDAARAQAVCP
jgi:hypothetical protein